MYIYLEIFYINLDIKKKSKNFFFEFFENFIKYFKNILPKVVP
jgi:hypothetical protein